MPSSSWRTFAPWTLLVLLLVAASIGAAAGLAASPSSTTSVATESNVSSESSVSSPARWVDQLLATTKAAGSAHFSYRSVTTSPTPELNSTDSGTGVVDFAARRLRVTQTLQQDTASQGRWQPHQAASTSQTFSMVTIGSQTWEGVDDQWTKVDLPHAAFDRLGLVFGSAALAAIDGPLPIATVRRLGPATVGGAATTRYLVATVRARPCNAKVAAAERGSSIGPTTVWVDGRGRLVRASFTTRQVVPGPASVHG
ncbi:MAG TPA: hypothetical protein VHD39_02295, partial [Acidimicrobiales bacterium]|nr:hypothetical protein [Acidimicrobiales bacterium]